MLIQSQKHKPCLYRFYFVHRDNGLIQTGLGLLLSVKGIQNATAYKDILDNFMFPTCNSLKNGVHVEASISTPVLLQPRVHLVNGV